MLNALIPGLIMFAAFMTLRHLGQNWMLLGPAVLGQLLVTWLLMAFIGRWTWRPGVLLALRRHGYDVCLGCGYSLQGLGASCARCPECGRRRDV